MSSLIRFYQSMGRKKTKLQIPKRRETTLERQRGWNDYYTSRNFGIGVQCTKCDKWRLAYQYKETHDVPVDFECSMTLIDGQEGNCDIPSNLSEDDFPPDKYTPGSLVWAKFERTWWPGIVEDNPDIEEYIWTDKKGKEVYNVTFFGDKVSHAWVEEPKIVPYIEKPKSSFNTCNKKLKTAIQQAEKANALDFQDRLKYFSLAVLYKGKWPKADDFGSNAVDPAILSGSVNVAQVPHSNSLTVTGDQVVDPRPEQTLQVHNTSFNTVVEVEVHAAPSSSKRTKVSKRRNAVKSSKENKLSKKRNLGSAEIRLVPNAGADSITEIDFQDIGSPEIQPVSDTDNDSNPEIEFQGKAPKMLTDVSSSSGDEPNSVAPLEINDFVEGTDFQRKSVTRTSSFNEFISDSDNDTNFAILREKYGENTCSNTQYDVNGNSSSSVGHVNFPMFVHSRTQQDSFQLTETDSSNDLYSLNEEEQSLFPASENSDMNLEPIPAWNKHNQELTVSYVPEDNSNSLNTDKEIYWKFILDEENVDPSNPINRSYTYVSIKL